MARYEATGAQKVWEITLTGKTFTVRWSQPGTKVRSQVKHFATAGEARAEYDKLVRQKVRAGYKLVAGTEESDLQTASETPVVAALRNLELEAAVIADPNDEGALMVLGDWLQTQGDPRGELISLQHAVKQAGTDPARFLERKRAADELYKRHEKTLLGPLHPLRHLIKLEWQLGYLRSARLSLEAARSEDPSLAQLLAMLVELPAAVALQELALVLPGPGYQDAIDEMTQTARPAALRTLIVGDPNLRSNSPIPTSLAQLDAFPELRRLVVHEPCALGSAVLLELRQLEIRDFGQQLVGWLTPTHAPKLEQLTFGFRAQVPDLGRASRFPKLRTLRFGYSDGLIEALAETELLARLEVVDLGRIGADDATLLIQRWPAYKHAKVRATVEVTGEPEPLDRRLRAETSATVVVKRVWR